MAHTADDRLCDRVQVGRERTGAQAPSHLRHRRAARRPQYLQGQLVAVTGERAVADAWRVHGRHAYAPRPQELREAVPLVSVPGEPLVEVAPVLSRSGHREDPQGDTQLGGGHRIGPKAPHPTDPPAPSQNGTSKQSSGADPRGSTGSPAVLSGQRGEVGFEVPGGVGDAAVSQDVLLDARQGVLR